MESSNMARNFLNHFGFQISTIPLPAERTRQKCSSIIPNSTNALDSGASAKITLNNRRINKKEFEESLLIPMKNDGLDLYRKEYNEMLLSKVSGTNNSIYQERYLTVSVHKKNIDEPEPTFARVGTDIITHLAKLSSIGEELDAESRLQIFRDFSSPIRRRVFRLI